MKKIKITPATVELFRSAMNRVQGAAISAFAAPQKSVFATYLQKSSYVLSVFRNRAGKVYLSFVDNGEEHTHAIPHSLYWNSGLVRSFVDTFLPRGREALSLALATEASGDNCRAWVSAQFSEFAYIDGETMREAPTIANGEVETIVSGLKTFFSAPEEN